tara:strand:- start:1047 stop:1715 length:669 start_codon:yes stop_codon:yes gene_type:complete
MYVLILGCGTIGYNLASELLGSGNEVLVLEPDPVRYSLVVNAFGSIAIQADGTKPNTLEKAGVRRADLLIAVTGDDSSNLVGCQVAKLSFNIPKTIALVNNPENESLFKKLGVDVTINQIDIILQDLEDSIPNAEKPSFFEMPLSENSRRKIFRVHVELESNVIGIKVNDIQLPDDTSLLMMMDIRGNTKEIESNTTIDIGDELVFIGDQDSIRVLNNWLTM